MSIYTTVLCCFGLFAVFTGILTLAPVLSFAGSLSALLAAVELMKIGG